MKKWFAALAALTAALPLWAFDTAELAARLQQPATVQGSFVQQRFVKSLDKPMQTEGRFAIQAKRGLHWHVRKPIELRLRVRPDGIAQWDSKNQQWRSGSQGGQAAQVKLFMAVLGGDLAGLQKQFDLKLQGNAQQWQLLLLPKTAVMKQVFHTITIRGSSHIRSVELREKQGDRTLMRFENVRTDQALDAEAQAALR